MDCLQEATGKTQSFFARTWLIKDPQFMPKKFGQNDVDIEIECCGVCGSDVHTINGGWGEAPLPLCVGHEVVGRAIQVGSAVTTVKVGDRVGVGAQVWSCLECKQCTSDNENYCEKMVPTYGGPYPEEVDPRKTMSQGGFASHIRAHEYFVFPIPDGIPPECAAPMMCAGLTVWSPLARAKIGPGKKVAVVGLGGLGHFAVMFANALGAEVTVISHSAHKRDDAFNLGAKDFVVNDTPGWAKPHRYAFDLVLNTADMTHQFNVPDYLSLCSIGGAFHQLGVPDAPLPPLSIPALIINGCAISGSHIGNRPECLAMLKLAEQKQLFPMIETIPISEEGLREAVSRVSKNKVKYRFVLTGYDSAFSRQVK
ncbi:uncharacterized protein PV07_01612 [Cladophialophora immunda]|uniref:Enoyl reductase (ER) domain-containing protein n=1 Tax=Cladophialophora immunda TaxID=569365 RepID=A0A0D2CY49_9EURO|nr:uncharacterized protein PV07_01612 [Cladophialophora immunda]KIW34865.1 hypothetical protein PV07_01612 [Cladophialophora immunda]OQV00867.1 hypothetical protein CLAIMM_06307 [Cladophialophora immunda]